jgi:hypothetical protein
LFFWDKPGACVLTQLRGTATKTNKEERRRVFSDAQEGMKSLSMYQGYCLHLPSKAPIMAHICSCPSYKVWVEKQVKQPLGSKAIVGVMLVMLQLSTLHQIRERERERETPHFWIEFWAMGT